MNNVDFDRILIPGQDQDEWLKYFFANIAKCQWFIEQYFGKQKYAMLHEMAQKKQIENLYSELNTIWFELPDGRFNIIEMPKGWREFLTLIEP